MDRWLFILVALALVATPFLFIRVRRACLRRAATSIDRIYADARRDAREPGPSVAFKYHTYAGFLIHAVETEHHFELPYPVAAKTLRALLRHNLTHGFFAEGVLLVPVLAFFSYLGQWRSIR